MPNLREIIFKDFVTLQRGFDLPSTKRVDGDYPVVASTSINGFHEEYKVEPPGVVTGRSGALGEVQYIETKFWPLNTTLWVKDFKGNFPRYVYYFLKTLDLKRFNSGAGVPTLNRNDLDTLEIIIHDDKAQRKIAAILSTYDRLIENNTRRIKILEEIARSLYDEWFVKFRFPGYEQTKMVDSELGLIPEGWGVGQLGKIASFQTGKLNSNAAKSNGVYPFFTCSQEVLRTDTYSFDTECILLAGNNANGIFHIKYFKGKFDVYQRTYIIRTLDEKRVSNYYLYFAIKAQLAHLRSISTGAATKFLTITILNNVVIILPDTDTQQKFSTFMVDVFAKTDVLQTQNKNLRQTRDLLLPKLISGEIDVENLDIETGIINESEEVSNSSQEAIAP